MSLKLIKVENISKEINAGEICAVIGKNGAGKSTLFKIMTGQITVTKGQLLYSYSEKRSPSIGALIERPAFFREMRTNTEKIAEILKLVEHTNNKILFSEFSLGMKQRLGLALALILTQIY
ncbi:MULTISPECIES: ATP-binding cassette domain-containing protein [unclassified Lysinibacillus]|uniref:ATP-binding cassette domain-containing protein n=1 Tax=unclassified Lysinibacillus TaxID=2636778 RepID=UPI0037FB92C5